MAEVVQFRLFREPEDSAEPRPNGSVKRRKGSRHLYVAFSYYGRRVEKSTGLEDTARNRRKARAFLDKIFDNIDRGTFVFSEAFPGASEAEKVHFACREGRDHRPDPGDVVFGEYLDRWIPEILDTDPSSGKRHDYHNIIDCHVRPRFGDMTFHQITGVEVVKFVRDLGQRRGRSGGKLSPSRIRNILIPLRIVWEDACDEHRWELADPFQHLKRRNRSGRLIPKRRKNPPEVFRFSEWEAVMEAIDPFYRPVAELMVMTGLINSEVAGLRVAEIQGDRLAIQHSIVRGEEKAELKTEYRRRQLPISQALRARLEILQARARGEHLVTMESGRSFHPIRFRNGVWTKAFKRAGVPYRRPYAMRHTFASWALIVGVHPSRVVALMGHGSKQMVYEVYAPYAEGIEGDVAAIREYLGPDFG
ncbi:MAG: DUF3596 domain-containing protein [Deferrisomatales bacterium]|nr:DUF3596 domain-containing protein [Deferrisomatales bacterium]